MTNQVEPTDLELRQIFWDEFAVAGLSRDGFLSPSIAVERVIVAAMRKALQASRSDAAPPLTDEEIAGCGGLK